MIDIGTKVYLGGATGKVTEITDTEVVVEGIYYYTNGCTIPELDESDSDPYCAILQKSELDKCDFWMQDIIDGSNLKMKWSIPYE